MAISRRRYITVENSFFERQPRIARHPTADRNEDEKPRNLGFNPPPPPPSSLVRLRLVYTDGLRFAICLSKPFQKFISVVSLPRTASFSPSVILEPNNIRVLLVCSGVACQLLLDPSTFFLLSPHILHPPF